MKEKLIKSILFICAFISIFFLLGITITLFTESLPFFKEVKSLDFLFGKHWYPTYYPPEFGILPLIVGTLIVTLGTMLVAVPLGLGAAIYISEVASHRIKEILKPAIELLASIPSVIYGLFGMVFLAPVVQKVFNIPIGLNAFTASIILGIMALPTVASIAEDAISSVPRSLREASFALGANRWETITQTVVPAASSGIIASIILGLGRAIGETMTVLMVAGGAAQIPSSIFEPVRTMTATIAAEMGETPMGSQHYQALFAIALVLFFITLAFNLLADIIAHRKKV
ncbi:MAG: phosphate ABC transporter permease subunit PstC [Candidatus Cloacimonetes bacterium]|nr:phosphate ABC transporter permease subunit PstC [Candidatus Cloacimonadota bacterium]MBS3767337.1 phosphate ABC transporter permease subunit PstC [Candidatus Cloacimonadota bacterium]